MGQPSPYPATSSTVPVSYPKFWRRLLAFSGPAYLVSVGYMDPGNWATDLEGGSRFGYELLWVLLASNLMAILLQSLSARLGIVAGQDLAQACRDTYSKPLNFTLWILCEVAVAACDLAEVIGTVIGLNLLFGLPPLVGLVLTGLDTFLFLAIQRLGVRKLEAFILALIATVGACFVPKDNATLRHAASLAQSHGAELVLIHVVEGLGGRIHGSDAADDERRADEAYLQQLQSTLADDGLTGFTVLCFGNPARQIVRAVKDERLDLLVLGSHGHGWFADWLFGETIRKVRHAVSIPVLVVRESTPQRPK